MTQENTVLDTIIDADEISPTATGSIYTILQIFLATIFGSPLAGAYMLARNCKTLLGEKQTVFGFWLLGIVMFMLPIISLFFFPVKEIEHLLIIPLVASVAMSLYANNSFGIKAEAFLRNGGKPQKLWDFCALTFAFFVLSLAIWVFIIVLISMNADDYGR